MNIEKTIQDNKSKIKENVKDLLILEVLYKEVEKITTTNKQKVLNYFNFKNATKIKHNLDDEPEFIKNPKIDYQLSNKDFKTYLDLCTILNLKNSLYTTDEEYGPELVINNQIVDIENAILKLFFPEYNYEVHKRREEFIELIKGLIVSSYNINTDDLNPKKFKVFGACSWQEDFTEKFFIKYQNNKKVLSFLNKEGFNLNEVL